jgi:hypothetical protein
MFSCCHSRDSSLSSLLEYTRVTGSVGGIHVVQATLRSRRTALAHVSVLGTMLGSNSSVLRSVPRALLLSSQHLLTLLRCFFGTQLICHPAIAINFCNYL